MLRCDVRISGVHEHVEGGGYHPPGNIVPPSKNPIFEKNIDPLFNYLNYSMIYTHFHITSVNKLFMYFS